MHPSSNAMTRACAAGPWRSAAAGSVGVVAAASYEARRFGVRSAMPSVTAKRQCPDLVFVPPRFDVYKAVSAQIHAVFARYTALIQPLSLDEAYLDVTAPLLDRGSATADRHRDPGGHPRRDRPDPPRPACRTTSSWPSLPPTTASPTGCSSSRPRWGRPSWRTCRLASSHGIGPVTAAKMNRLGIHTGLDLRAQSLDVLVGHFGKAADYYYGVARGHDDRPGRGRPVRKSVGAENTFARDLTHWEEVGPVLEPVFAKVWAACGRGGHAGRTMTVKVKYADFRQITRRPVPVCTRLPRGRS